MTLRNGPDASPSALPVQENQMNPQPPLLPFSRSGALAVPCTRLAVSCPCLSLVFPLPEMPFYEYIWLTPTSAPSRLSSGDASSRKPSFIPYTLLEFFLAHPHCVNCPLSCNCLTYSIPTRHRASLGQGLYLPPLSQQILSEHLLCAKQVGADDSKAGSPHGADLLVEREDSNRESRQDFR